MIAPRHVQRASRPVELYGFEDDDFSKYPCIKIPETNYTIDEYETIANSLLGMLASSDKQVFSKAARGIAVLAYNTLMDPIDCKETDPRPFFHKYTETEPWMLYRDEPAIDLGELCQPHSARRDADSSLRLVKLDASDFDRKSSIGVWALLHLRAFGQIPHQALRKSLIEFHDERGEKLMLRKYHTLSTYEIPALSENAYKSLKDEYKNQRNTEILYLFFRSAIIFEQNFENRDFRNQKSTLGPIVFAGYHGLRHGGLWLWHDFKNASKELKVMDIRKLCNCFYTALKDSNCLADPGQSREILEIFHQFYVEYEWYNFRTGLNLAQTRYHMYAHVLNNSYFYWIGSRDVLVLSHALHLISKRPHLSSPPSPYKRWSELIAKTIFEHGWSEITRSFHDCSPSRKKICSRPN